MKRLLARTTIAALVLLAAVGGVATAVLVTRGGGPESADLPEGEVLVRLMAEEADNAGIAPDTAFVLESSVPLTRAAVQAALAVEPTVPLRIERTAEREFRVTPEEALAEDTPYRFRFVRPHDGSLLASWAFQVVTPLRVVSTLPGDKRTGVPLDTGIEVTFSHEGVLISEAYVEISPPLEGHFERHKRTVVFVPRELAPETLYTVRIRAGTPVEHTGLVLEEEYVFQFETGTALRLGFTPPFLAFQRRVSEFATSEPPPLLLDTSDSETRSLPVAAYRYPNIDAMVADIARLESLPPWATATRGRFTVDRSALETTAAFEALLERSAPDGGFSVPQAYLRFPEALPAGYYLIEATYGGRPVQAWLQVTDVSAFAAVTQTETLVWVNDVASGRPLAGVEVRFESGPVLGRTDAEGIARFATPAAAVYSQDSGFGFETLLTRGYLLVSDQAGRRVAIPLGRIAAREYDSGPFAFSSAGARYDYWTFFALDRPIYQPDDTVRFWGVLKAREGDPRRRFEVRLRASGSESAVFARPVTVQASDLGTVTGELPLRGLAAGYYRLDLSQDGRVIASAYFQVGVYQKPAYEIEIIPARRAIFEGEEMEVTFKATFFDGTPVPGLELRYSTEKGTEGSLTTGADGTAVARILAAFSVQGGLYSSMWLYAVPARSEEGQILTETAVAVLPAAVGIRAQSSFTAGSVTITGDLHDLDIARLSQDLDRGAADLFTPPGRQTTPGYFTTPVAGRVVDVEITEYLYDRIEVGERYDFINKVTYKVYRYQQRQVSLPRRIVTTDAQGSFTLSFPSEANRYLSVTLSAADAQGRRARLTTFVRSTLLDLYGPTFTHLELGDAGEDPYFASGRYAIGDTPRLTMYRGPQPLPEGTGRYLFYLAQRGLMGHAVQASPRYSFTFAEEHVPNVFLGAVYFNGFTYLESRTAPALAFDPESRRLEVSVTAAKERYEPGEEATVEVLVTDAGGRPVRAEVNLAAVDEALFKLEAYSYEGDILRSLYSFLPSGVLRTYASHPLPEDLIAPGGRGGNGGARQDFVDLAFYGSVWTGADGRASVSFKLPDNLTSWRVTAIAVTAALEGGKGLGRVAVGLPLFVDITAADEYLASDEPVIRLRAFGSGLSPGQQVSFSVEAPGLGLAQPVTVSGPAFEPAYVALPRLTAGDHELRVTVSAGGSRDTVVRRLRVVSSRLLRPEVRSYPEVDSSTRYEGGHGRTEVVIADGGRGRYHATLLRLSWTYGDRADQALARHLAGQLLKQYFGQEPRPAEFDATPYLQTARAPGALPGVAILPFAEPDLALTARAAALAPDLFGRNVLRGFLSSIADDRRVAPDETALALYGLAALGEPVLWRLYVLAEEDLGWRGRLYLGLAYLAAGDESAARDNLALVDGPLGEDLGPLRRIRAGFDEDDTLEATALGALLAAGLGEQKAEALFRYVEANGTTDILLELEQISYLKLALERASAEEPRLAYTVDGRREETTLRRGAVLALLLTPEELRGLRVEPLRGAVSVTTMALAPLRPGDAELSSGVTVTRTYRAVGAAAPATAFAETSLIAVTLQLRFSPQAPDGCYQVTDLLPSGLKPVTRPGATPLIPGTRGVPAAAVFFPYLIDGQRVSFCAFKNTTTITYYARPSGKGRFTAEPAVVHNQRVPAVANMSAPSTLTIE
jgi:hypothetical protein